MHMPALRPLGFGEILDRAFTLYRHNLVLFLGTSVLLMMASFVGAMLLIGLGAVVMTVMPNLIGFLAMALVFVAAMALFTIPWGALARQASQAYTGKHTSLGDGTEAGGGAAMTLLGSGIIAGISLGVLMLLVGLVVYFLNLMVAGLGISSLSVGMGIVSVLGFGAAFCLVTALYFAVVPAVIVEGKGPMEAVTRSLELAQGALPRIAGTMVVALLITYLPQIALGFVTGAFTGLGDPAQVGAQQVIAVLMQQLLSLAITMLTMPFLVNVMVVLYYDRRVRSEALDVQMVTDQLGLATA
ncbi:MAG TPA: hypothetical protein VLK84_07950 [Longimicrobium sp.]|nr:hypothetical protein [Longimicrobium sp.]